MRAAAAHGAATAAAAQRRYPARAPPNATTVVPLSTPPLVVRGLAAAEGIFDPSVVATGDAATPYLGTLSAVQATDDISTALVVFDAASESWVLASRVNQALVNATLPCAGRVSCVGNLIHEVSSVVVDADDPDPARRVKVFAHTYVVTNGSTLHYDWGYISLFTAPSATGPWGAQPLLGWAGASNLSTAGVAQVLTDTPQLADCLAFTEPGAFAAAGPSPRLLLALGCVAPPPAPGATAPIRVVLLASGDHGASWAWASTLVDGATDAARLGFAVPQLNAADLFAAAPPGGGPPRLFLSVTPSSELWPGFVGYDGCLVVAVLADGSGVERDAATGAPVVVRAVVTDAVAFAGACTAAASAVAPGAGGYLLPALTPGTLFRVLPSGVAPA